MMAYELHRVSCWHSGRVWYMSDPHRGVLLQSIVYALNGLLIPGTVASSSSAGVQAPPATSTSATGSASGSRKLR